MDLAKGLKTALRQTPSQASISTRVSSADSLTELGREAAPVPLAPKQAQPSALGRSLLSRVRDRPLLLAAAAALLVWLWSRRIARAKHSISKWGPGRLSLLLASGVSLAGQLLGIKGYSQIAEEPSSVPDRQVMAILHPHGCYLLGGLMNLAKEPRNKRSPFYGVFIAGADGLFQLPLVREFALLMNARPAKAAMIDVILGHGKSVGLCPGGIHEMLATDSAQERLFFPPKLGFIRQALKHGVPLMPIYTFGENQLFDVPEWSRGISQALHQSLVSLGHTGAGVPLPIGRWGLPFVPKAGEVRSCVGSIVEVGPADASPSDERVRDVFLAYCAEVHRLFAANRDALPPAVAARGLEMVWRGHEDEDLSAQRFQDWQVNPSPLEARTAVQESKSSSEGEESSANVHSRSRL